MGVRKVRERPPNVSGESVGSAISTHQRIAQPNGTKQALTILLAEFSTRAVDT